MDYCYKYFNYVSILAIFTDQGKPYLDVKNADISKHLLLKKKKKERKTLRSYFAILTTLSISVLVSKNFVICQVKNRNYFLFMTNSFPNDLLNGKRDVLFN